MKPFKSHKGIVATLDRANVDTDQIIAKQFLKSIAKTGFGPHLFHDWRYTPDGKPNLEFPLNEERFKNATILVAKNNFGCGSSREHAVWAIHQYGFQVVIAPWREQAGEKVPAFADIFRNNSYKNALLTIELSELEVQKIFETVDRNKGLQATVDLEAQKVILHAPQEISFRFDVDKATKERLLHGLDDIGITLKHESKISRFEASHQNQLAW